MTNQGNAPKTPFTGRKGPGPGRAAAEPGLLGPAILCVYSGRLGRGLNCNLSIFCRSGALHVNKRLFGGRAGGLGADPVAHAGDMCSESFPNFLYRRTFTSGVTFGRAFTVRKARAELRLPPEQGQMRGQFGLAFGLMRVYSARPAAARPGLFAHCKGGLSH